MVVAVFCVVVVVAVFCVVVVVVVVAVFCVVVGVGLGVGFSVVGGSGWERSAQWTLKAQSQTADWLLKTRPSGHRRGRGAPLTHQ